MGDRINLGIYFHRQTSLQEVAMEAAAGQEKNSNIEERIDAVGLSQDRQNYVPVYQFGANLALHP